jgi:hypothetical protein
VIRAVYQQRGGLSAAIELRRWFPGITDNAQARECVRTIAGWCRHQPLALIQRRAESFWDREIVALNARHLRLGHDTRLNLVLSGNARLVERLLRTSSAKTPLIGPQTRPTPYRAGRR